MGTAFTQMTKAQKLAALLVLLGPETAAQLLRGLEVPEIEIITREMATIRLVDPETQRELLREFTAVAMQATASVPGGITLAETVLEKAVGPRQTSNILSRVAPNRTTFPALQQLRELTAQEILTLVRSEPPQMIALVLSFLLPEKASEVLSMLSVKLSEEIIERLATLGPTPGEVVEKLVGVLISRLGPRNNAPQNAGGVKTAAELLNALDQDTRKGLVSSIEERNPELGQAIRRKMVRFQEVAAMPAFCEAGA